MTITDMLGPTAVTHQPSAKGAGKHSAAGFNVAMRDAIGSDAAPRRGMERTIGGQADHQVTESPLDPNRPKSSETASTSAGVTAPSDESAFAESGDAMGEAPVSVAECSDPDHPEQTHSGLDRSQQAQTEFSQAGTVQSAGTELNGMQAGTIVGGLAAAIVADPTGSAAAAAPATPSTSSGGARTATDTMEDGVAGLAAIPAGHASVASTTASHVSDQTTSTTGPAATAALVGASTTDGSDPSSGEAATTSISVSAGPGEAHGPAIVPASTPAAAAGAPSAAQPVAPVATPLAEIQTGTPVAASPSTPAATGILTSAVWSSTKLLTEIAGERAAGSPTAPTVQATVSTVDAGVASGAVPTAAPANAPAPGAPIPSAPVVPTAPTHATLAPQLARPIFTLAAAGAGEHVMTINVTPDNLGPVTVRAHIGADGIRLEVFAPTDVARDALRTILPDLRRDLAGSGMNANVSLSEHGKPADAGNSGGGTGNGGQSGSGDATRQSGNAQRRPGGGNTMPSHRARNLYDSTSTIDLLA